MVPGSNVNAIYAYQLTLLNKYKSVPLSFFDGDTKSNEKTAIAIIRYAVEEHLHWTPEEMRYHFDDKVIKRMKLDKVVTFIQFPPENSRTDFYIYAHKLYPDRIPVDFVDSTLRMYNKVISNASAKFPKGFFDDINGRYRAIICLRYVLANVAAPFRNQEELYLAFASSSGNSFLQKHRLYKARRLIFDSPVEFLQEALNENERDYFYYGLVKLIDSGLLDRVRSS